MSTRRAGLAVSADLSVPAPIIGCITVGERTLTFNSGGSKVILTGGSIPANGSVTVTVDVTARAAGTYINTLSAGALQTSNGNNTAPAVAALIVN